MSGRIWKLARNMVVAVVGFAVVVMLLPTKARSQLGLDPCCAIISVGLSAISNLLSSAVAKPLSAIQQLEQDAANFEQQVVFPVAAINQARGLATQFQGQFAQMKHTFQLPVASATLPTAQQLEQDLLSRNPNSVSQITTNYAALYGAVMPATDAPQQVRDFVDITDAEAQAAMKKAVEIDSLADLELQAAEQINQQLATAAPGSAAILEAQASAWLVRANAYTQSAMAELVRVRSIELANRGAQLKFSTAHTTNLHSSESQVLQGAH
jgi:NADH dehydrogenase/NADH:ubiquinone oxidoreductase subunit G